MTQLCVPPELEVWVPERNLRTDYNVEFFDDVSPRLQVFELARHPDPMGYIVLIDKVLGVEHTRVDHAALDYERERLATEQPPAALAPWETFEYDVKEETIVRAILRKLVGAEMEALGEVTSRDELRAPRNDLITLFRSVRRPLYDYADLVSSPKDGERQNFMQIYKRAASRSRIPTRPDSGHMIEMQVALENGARNVPPIKTTQNLALDAARKAFFAEKTRSPKDESSLEQFARRFALPEQSQADLSAVLGSLDSRAGKVYIREVLQTMNAAERVNWSVKAVAGYFSEQAVRHPGKTITNINKLLIDGHGQTSAASVILAANHFAVWTHDFADGANNSGLPVTSSKRKLLHRGANFESQLGTAFEYLYEAANNGDGEKTDPELERYRETIQGFLRAVFSSPSN